MRFLAVAGAMLIMVVQVIYSGWVFSWLWEWFIRPFGLPSIGIAWAIGLNMVFRRPGTEGQKPADRDAGEWLIEKIAEFFFMMSFIFLLGWIIHKIMVG
jgi:hypothetical protein